MQRELKYKKKLNQTRTKNRTTLVHVSLMIEELCVPPTDDGRRRNERRRRKQKKRGTYELHANITNDTQTKEEIKCEICQH